MCHSSSSLSAAQLNEVNKLLRVYCFLLHLSPCTSTLFLHSWCQHCSVHPRSASFVLSSQLKFFLPPFLTSFYCHCSTAKALGFPPSFFFFFPGQSCNYNLGEKKASCADKACKKTKLRAPLRGGEHKLLSSTHQSHISQTTVLFYKVPNGDARDQTRYNESCCDLVHRSWLLNHNTCCADSSDMRRMHPAALGAAPLDTTWTWTSWKLRSVTEVDVLGENQMYRTAVIAEIICVKT